MEVLEERPQWSMERRCAEKYDFEGGCNSLLRIDENDIVIIDPRKREPFNEYAPDPYPACVCPVCGKELRLYDVPRTILNRVEYKAKYGNEDSIQHRR